MTSEPGCCKYCDDGTGQSVYPMAGQAPSMRTPNGLVYIRPVDWPLNFRCDPKIEHFGTYRYCTHCWGHR